MRIYVDSSALVKRGLLETESIALSNALDQWNQAGDALLSSSLAWIEVSRAIRSQLEAESPGFVAEQVEIALSGIDEFMMTEAVINVARRIAGPPLRSLDAIHLASATLIDADLIVAYDERLIQSANEMGFVTSSPGS